MTKADVIRLIELADNLAAAARLCSALGAASGPSARGFLLHDNETVSAAARLALSGQLPQELIDEIHRLSKETVARRNAAESALRDLLPAERIQSGEQDIKAVESALAGVVRVIAEFDSLVNGEQGVAV